MKSSKIGYDVYCNLFGNNLVKLNLTSCKNSKISIFIPIKINEPLDKLNSSSGYYNDICYTTTSDYGTDITLNDRKKDFIDQDRAICQEECQFSKYNEIKKIAECSCKAKESSSFIDDISFNKKKLLKNFKDIKNILNFNFLVCYRNLFNINGIKNNIGCYITLVIIIFHIISIFILYINQYPLLKKKIKKIIFLKNNYANLKVKVKEKKTKKQKGGLKGKEKINSIKISIYKNSNRKREKGNIIKKIKSTNEKGTKQIIFNNNKNIINIDEYIDDEINELSYNLAKIHDKRTFCQYYFSLIKTKHSLIFSFFNNTDYNSFIVKMDLFFLGFTTDYIINALFYNDETMHKIYKSKGEFDLEAQLPIIIYSTLISFILNSAYNFLALSNDAIINFKQDNSKINTAKRAKNLMNILTIKFIFYYIISFILLIFFWYYISMFCVIYRNTKVHLLKDTLMSFYYHYFFLYLLI